MAGRRLFHWLTLAILAAVAAAPACRADPAVEVLRLKPEVDNKSPASLWANNVYTWEEGGEQVYALSGSVLIQQDRTAIWADRAVVWLDADAIKKRKPVKMVVYADKYEGKRVGIEVRGKARQEADAAVIEFVTAAVGSIRGKEQKKSLADSPAYKVALAARGDSATTAGDKTPPPPKMDELEPAQFVRPPGPGGAGDPLAESAITGTAVLPVPLTDTRTLWISPRTNRPFNVYPITSKDKDETAFIITGGIKLMAHFTTGPITAIEIEADQVVIWHKGKDGGKALGAMTSKEGSQGADGIELYLTGDVVIRYGAKSDLPIPGVPPKPNAPPQLPGVPSQTRTLRAERVYYDVNKHRAIAIGADLEYTRQGYLNTGHLLATELQQLSTTELTGFDAILHASRLPSDPNFTVRMDRADVYQQPHRVRTTIFGESFRQRDSDRLVEEDPDILDTENMTVRVRDVPIFWLPSTRTTLNDPFGPFNGVTFRRDKVFGYQAYATWDMLDLIGLTKAKGEKWTLLTDYMSERGPALGTNYTRNDQMFMDTYAPYQTAIKLYGLQDAGHDVLGGSRSTQFEPTAFRGRALWRHQQEFSLFEPDDLTYQHQFSYLSDRNFLEQYYNNEFHYLPNLETFMWVKYQTGNAAASFLVEPDTGRNWNSETFWLPRVDGYLIGQSLLDRFTYNTWASVAYARLDPYRQPPNQFPDMFDNGLPRPEVPVNTGRVDWMQQISAPFDAGPFKIVPYAVGDLAYYTQDVGGDPRGRVYGGAGVKASVPLSRLYRDVESELFNVQGFYHKNEFTANYFLAGSSASWAILPQLDRLNDDATEQAWTDITPWQKTFTYLPAKDAQALGNGSWTIFDPRLYAIRRIVDTRPDTLDDIQVLQLAWNQRLQTKRGYPGLEHTVDWLIFDTSATIFPAANRDNFGSSVGFLEYHAVWNVGDATAFYSNGWYDPFQFGAKYWEVGTVFSRDDRTSVSLAYREVEPIHSRVVSAATTYVFSPKYALTAITAYDFSSQASFTNILQFTRVGTDLQITLGITYNSLIKTAGINLSVVPNLLATTNTTGASGLGSNRNNGR